MGPFETPTSLVTGLKERAEAVTVQADRLYIGTSAGSLLIYSLEDSPGILRKLVYHIKRLTPNRGIVRYSTGYEEGYRAASN